MCHPSALILQPLPSAQLGSLRLAVPTYVRDTPGLFYVANGAANQSVYVLHDKKDGCTCTVIGARPDPFMVS